MMSSAGFFRLLFLLCLAGFLYSCQDETDDIVKSNNEGTEVFLGKPYTIKKGKLIALMDNSLSSYFIYKGQPKGFEFEMLDLFARQYDLELEIKIIEDVDHILDSLIAGKGDLAAANLAVSEKRLERVDFTEPLFQTRQVLVQRLPDNYRKMTADQIRDHLVTDPIDLAGKTVTIRKNSSYYERLENFSKETSTPIEIQLADAHLVTDNLIEMVSKGDIDFTVSDENKARLIASFYKNINTETPISFSQNIGWATRKEADQLLDTLNEWITNEKGSLEYNVIYNKYFDPSSKTKADIRREYEEIKKGSISDYDELIREYAQKINWDWKLLSSLVYKESGFDPEARSWVGALGLMQVMPSTAEEYGVSSEQLFVPETNVKIGSQYLEWLERQWTNVIQDSAEVLKFTLASYNVGYGHVSDARRLAKSSGMNPDQWENSVEQMLLLKSKPKYYNREEVYYGYCKGSEPVNYVKDILDYYNFYNEFVSKKELLAFAN